MTDQIASANRLFVIDKIRGTALLGILLFNIQTYALFAFLRPEQVYSLGFDTEVNYSWTQFITQTLVKGQFYSIYSFLFGLGFFMIMKNTAAKGLDSSRIFKRRLWTLLAFGLVHGIVFWFGDVLHKYAILGFTLLYFNKKSNVTLIKWIVGLAIAVLVFQVLKAFLGGPVPSSPDPTVDKVIMEVVHTWQYGNIVAVFNLQKLGMAMLWISSIMNGFASFVHFEIMFLLGLMAGRLNLFNRITEISKKYLKYALISLSLIIGLKAFSAIDLIKPEIVSIPYMKSLMGVAEFIATPLLSIIYILFLSVLFEKKDSIIFRWMGNAGRLGLTNYLLQTFICMLLFYGYAGRLAGQLSLAQSLVAALFIYIFQLIFSTVWLRYYQTGPFEQLWRRISYGSKKV